MSHSINLQSMLERLLLLEHIAFGSQEFCSTNGIASWEETGYLQPLSPRTLMKRLICESLIDVAIKGRILLDHVALNNSHALKRIEKQAGIGLRISYDSRGRKNLSIRETLNKIIHATQVSVSYDPSPDEPSETYFWDGQVHLVGTHDKVEWSHRIVVTDWAKALRRLVIQLIQDDELSMLGWDGGF